MEGISGQPLYLWYAGIGAAALVCSVPMTAWMIRLGQRLGRLDTPNPEIAHKIDAAGVPNTGGIAIVTALIIAWGLAAWLPMPANPERWELPTGAAPPTSTDPPAEGGLAVEVQGGLPGVTGVPGVLPGAQGVQGAEGGGPLPRSVQRAATWDRYRDSLEQHGTAIRQIGWILLGLLLIHLLGLWDDWRAMKAGPKLAGQLVVALLLVIPADLRILQLMDGWGLHGLVFSHLISLFWILLIVNAINFMDNMDGLAAGTAAAIALLYLAAGVLTDQFQTALMAAGLAGAALGFLWFNRHPARLYMGDSGSMVLGLALAVISIRTTYYDPAGIAGQPVGFHAILMPLVLLAVPLYDLAGVCLLRISQGKSIWVGDKQHLSHRLVKRGYPINRAVGIIWLCAVASGLGGIMLGRLAPWQGLVIGAQAAAVLMMLAMLEWPVGADRQADAKPTEEETPKARGSGPQRGL